MHIAREKTLVIVFDGARARFFERKADGRLIETLTEINSALHAHTRDAVSDKPGRGFASAGGTSRHAFESKHDEHKMEKHNFVHALVKELDHSWDLHEFDRLIVVAPERSLGEFRSLAPDKLKRAIWREMPKELANFSHSEIEKHLSDYLKVQPA
jgi:protein required for attachment to host cells